MKILTFSLEFYENSIQFQVLRGYTSSETWGSGDIEIKKTKDVLYAKTKITPTSYFIDLGAPIYSQNSTAIPDF